nr:hypothetical protein [uncultured Flavobacterium sp.]
MTEQKKYYEIGRGAKLIPMEYWHQFVLGIDPSDELNFIVVSEVGKNEILYRKQISLEDIQDSKWDELLEISQTKNFIKELNEIKFDKKLLRENLNLVVENIENTKIKLNGNWISIGEYGNLNYNSNFGNWVDASEIAGKLKFGLNIDGSNKNNCHVEIPVNYLCGGDGYFSIQMGRFELSKNQILIWQNDVFPSMIKHNLLENQLTLELYEHEIKFIKE